MNSSIEARALSVVYMKYLIVLLLILNVGQLFGQSNTTMAFELSDRYKKDSIQIENIVAFYKYPDTDTTDAVSFTIKITNLGDQPIPNFENVLARSEFLKLFINGNDAHDMNIQNGIGPNTIKYLGKGESDTFETGWVLSKNSGAYRYDHPIKVMWQYLGINARVVVVDIVNKQIKG